MAHSASASVHLALCSLAPQRCCCLDRHCLLQCCLGSLRNSHLPLLALCHRSDNPLSPYSILLCSSFCAVSLHPSVSMPHVQQKMRRSRGSSRGRTSRPQSSSDTPSEDVAYGHIPETRSKRGRVGSGLSSHGFASTSQPSPHSDAPPVVLRHSSQRAEFQFKCTMECPVLTAYITVSLQEEASGSKTPDKPTLHSPLALDRTACEKAGQEHTREGKAKEKEDAPITTDEHESGSDEYRCRVVEEPPPPADIK